MRTRLPAIDLHDPGHGRSVMARVRDIEIDEVPADLRPVYRRYAESYGPFLNQVKVFAHRAPALRHVMGMLLELADEAVLPKRYLEIALVAVSRANECTYCVAHHAPRLVGQGLRPASVAAILEPEVPGFDEVDTLVRDFAVAVTEDARRMPAAMVERLKAHFSEEQIVEAHAPRHPVRLLQPLQRGARDRDGRRRRGGDARGGGPDRGSAPSREPGGGGRLNGKFAGTACHSGEGHSKPSRGLGQSSPQRPTAGRTAPAYPGLGGSTSGPQVRMRRIAAPSPGARGRLDRRATIALKEAADSGSAGPRRSFAASRTGGRSRRRGRNRPPPR